MLHDVFRDEHYHVFRDFFCIISNDVLSLSHESTLPTWKFQVFLFYISLLSTLRSNSIQHSYGHHGPKSMIDQFKMLMFHEITMEIPMKIPMKIPFENLHFHWASNLRGTPGPEVHPRWAAPLGAAQLLCRRPARWQLVVDGRAP